MYRIVIAGLALSFLILTTGCLESQNDISMLEGLTFQIGPGVPPDVTETIERAGGIVVKERGTFLVQSLLVKHDTLFIQVLQDDQLVTYWIWNRYDRETIYVYLGKVADYHKHQKTTPQSSS